ncbi:MAG TPA: hypothetical protein PKA63_03670 [Oligoflexia bacterium]|nr:hypothetical protein [Oligoflexia bacterium]HMP47753.1 hypothetical protein [Oligoflexia bacterium]
MINLPRLLLSCIIIPASLVACSSEPPKPDPGRCFTNIDCKSGEECVNTRCQDLYYPKHKIKQR